jgi:hypothetical protein
MCLWVCINPEIKHLVCTIEISFLVFGNCISEYYLDESQALKVKSWHKCHITACLTELKYFNSPLPIPAQEPHKLLA